VELRLEELAKGDPVCKESEFRDGSLPLSPRCDTLEDQLPEVRRVKWEHLGL
jgi:hypothetical protein